MAVLCLAAMAAGCARPATDWRPRYVILVSMDTCRADHLGCYGYARPTSPNVDWLARHGVVFCNAFSQSNESLFSYSSLFTSRYPRDLGALGHEDFRLGRQEVVLSALLQANGVNTAAFVAGGHLNAQFGFDRGFGVYEDRWNFGSFFHTMPPALDWLGSQQGDEARGFLFIQAYDAHDPYEKPMFFSSLYDADYRGIAREIIGRRGHISRIYGGRYFGHIPLQAQNAQLLQSPDKADPLFLLKPMAERGVPSVQLTDADVRALVAAYDGAISYADVFVGLLVARIYELGIQNDVLLVFMGDHGEELMDQGYFTHRAVLHDSELHVPLVVWAPGSGLQPHSVDDLVELMDVAPTILDFMGLPPAEAMRGRSLKPLTLGLPGSAVDASAISEGIFPPLSIRTSKYRLVFNGVDLADPHPRASLARQPMNAKNFGLFDVTVDSRGERNLLERPVMVPIGERLRREMLGRLRWNGR